MSFSSTCLCGGGGGGGGDREDTTKALRKRESTYLNMYYHAMDTTTNAHMNIKKEIKMLNVEIGK